PSLLAGHRSDGAATPSEQSLPAAARAGVVGVVALALVRGGVLVEQSECDAAQAVRPGFFFGWGACGYRSARGSPGGVLHRFVLLMVVIVVSRSMSHSRALHL